MHGIRRHYDRVAAELAADDDEAVPLPAPQPRDRAGLQDAQADPARARLRPGHPAARLEALTVGGRRARRPRRCRRSGTRAASPVPLTVARLALPRDHPAGLDYVRGIRRASPRDVVTVFIPEYVVGHWWEQLLHNQSALRLKGRLLFQPGVMVTSVPWQLRSSERREDDDAGSAARGRVTRPARPAMTEPSSARGALDREPRSPSCRAAALADLELEVGAVAHGGHCVARPRRPGGLRAARAARRAGPRRRHRRRDARVPARRRRRGARAVAGPGRRRRARTPVPAAAAAATGSTSRCRRSGGSRPRWSRSSCAGWPASSATSSVEAGPRAPRRPGLAHPRAVRRRRRGPRRAAQAPLARPRAGRRLPDRRTRRRGRRRRGLRWPGAPASRSSPPAASGRAS